jgi:hypothetical protein
MWGEMGNQPRYITLISLIFQSRYGAGNAAQAILDCGLM